MGELYVRKVASTGSDINFRRAIEGAERHGLDLNCKVAFVMIESIND